MCILFMYVGSQDPESDYILVLAANRDELYDRPSLYMAPWEDDQDIIGGRDLEIGCDGGTWMAMSPKRKKIGALLNLPRVKNPKAKTRGKIVQDFMKSTISTTDYVDNMRKYFQKCNDFVFVTVELSENPTILTYSNENDKINTWTGSSFGFSNSLPEQPLEKALAGKDKIQEICSRFKKVSEKDKLINELISMLKSKERHLPDPELETRNPGKTQHLSSIFVRIPEVRYGTRTHTIILVTKSGHVVIVEQTMQAPIDVSNPIWKTSEYQFHLNQPYSACGPRAACGLPSFYKWPEQYKTE